MNQSFTKEKLSEKIKMKITGISFPKYPQNHLSYDDLRYLKVLHVGFDGRTKEGEIICNKKIADSLLEIFQELYKEKYPIEKIRLIDEYGADDEKSMADNNSSAFCYRVIAETDRLSNHALGMAIDINPFYNPYTYVRKDGSLFLQPDGCEEYLDRSKNCDYYLTGEDLCTKLFKEHGFSWGGDWIEQKDYQHFEFYYF